MIHENFLLEKVLKESPRGQILLLRHRETKQRMVARRFAGSGEAYRQMMSLSCPHLPRVEACAEKDGQVLVLEEYIPGDSLAFVLQGGPLRPEQTRRIAADVARALQALHRLSIVHRDVKPENILLNGDRTVLIDFDASRVCKEEVEADTRVMGTTGYAAPEQFGLSQTDARADIYSLGVLINEMLTLQHPSRHLAEAPLRPIIEKCIEVNVDKRYHSADELLTALLRKRPPLSPPRRELLFFAGASAVLLAAVLLLAGMLLRPGSTASESISAATQTSSPAAPDTEPSGVQLIQQSENQSYTAFSCDLDGDGVSENYVFCIYTDIGGPDTALSPGGTDHCSLPEGTIRRTDFTPVVLRQLPGGYEFAEELAPLLQDVRLEVVPVYTLDIGTPATEDAAPLNGLWSGSRSITYTADCSGLWRYKAAAVLNGHSLTAASTTAINLLSSSTEAPSESSGFRLANPAAPVNGLEILPADAGPDDIHYTRFTCDLDGDGQEETYAFRMAFNLTGDELTAFSTDSRLLLPDMPTTHIFVPAVFVLTDDGFEPADWFRDLLEDVTLEFTGLAPRAGESPSVTDGQSILGWENGKEITYTADCAGQWQYRAAAVFNGQTLTAAAVTNISLADS